MLFVDAAAARLFNILRRFPAASHRAAAMSDARRRPFIRLKEHYARQMRGAAESGYAQSPHAAAPAARRRVFAAPSG